MEPCLAWPFAQSLKVFSIEARESTSQSLYSQATLLIVGGGKALEPRFTPRQEGRGRPRRLASTSRLHRLGLAGFSRGKASRRHLRIAAGRVFSLAKRAKMRVLQGRPVKKGL